MIMKTEDKTCEIIPANGDHQVAVMTTHEDLSENVNVQSKNHDVKNYEVTNNTLSSKELRLEIIQLILMMLSILTFLYYDFGKYLSDLFQ